VPRQTVNEADKGEVVDNMSRGRDMAREKNFKTKTYLTRKGNGKCSGRKTLMHTYGKKLSGAVKRLLMMPYTRRQMKARKATMSWSQLGNALVAKGFPPEVRGNKKPRPFANSALMSLLKDMQRLRL
jgi:hypothetical protein